MAHTLHGGPEAKRGAQDLERLASSIPSGRAEGDGRGSGLWMVGLALLAFAVHAPGIFAGFVFDDVVTIVRRPAVDWSRVPRFFTTNQSAFFGSNFYRPVLNAWYELSYALCGTHAARWHGLGILLHVACTLLVFRLALRVLENPAVAAMATALFAVHPAHVEAISWASAMGDPLMTLFLLLSVVAFLRWMERRNPLWWAASFAAGATCVLTKEPGVVLPVVLLVSALALRSRARLPVEGSTAATDQRPVLRPQGLAAATLPFFALSFGFLFLRHSVLGAFAHPVIPASTAQMISTWPSVLLFYLRHMFCPTAVVPYYPLTIVTSWNSRQFFGPLIGLMTASTVLGYALWRSAGWRKFCVCLVWILAPLAPVLYLKAMAPFELVHDRFLYAPLVGFCMAAALVLQWATEWMEAWLEWRVLPLVAVILISLLSVESLKQMLWWQNNLTLFTRAVAVAPGSSHALAALAAADAAVGRYDEGVRLLQRAVDLDPRNSAPLYDALARIAWGRGDDAGAEKNLIQALGTDPRGDVWLDLATVEMHRNRVDAAEAAARQSLAMDPPGTGAHGVLGTILLAKGDAAGAAREFREQLRLDPHDEVALAGLARATANPAR